MPHLNSDLSNITGNHINIEASNTLAIGICIAAEVFSFV